uniref:Uncharacterized protein n=1 Tax=Helianthus annuus TaxID=4232 RepID=A0A251TPB4_HELAN
MRFQWKDMLYMRFHRNNGIDWFLAMPVVTVVISASQHRAETRTDVKVSRLNLLFLLWYALGADDEAETSVASVEDQLRKEITVYEWIHVSIGLFDKCAIPIAAELEYKDENKIYSGILEKYSDVWMEHLKELVIYNFNNSKPSMEFVKFIIPRSPKLIFDFNELEWAR